MNYCPFNLLSCSPPPSPPFLKSKYSILQIVCGWEGYWVVLETIFCRSLTLCFWQDWESTKLPNHPIQKPRRWCGLWQISTCRKVPLQVILFRYRQLALLSISLTFLRPTQTLPSYPSWWTLKCLMTTSPSTFAVFHALNPPLISSCSTEQQKQNYPGKESCSKIQFNIDVQRME